MIENKNEKYWAEAPAHMCVKSLLESLHLEFEEMVKPEFVQPRHDERLPFFGLKGGYRYFDFYVKKLNLFITTAGKTYAACGVHKYANRDRMVSPYQYEKRLDQASKSLEIKERRCKENGYNHLVFYCSTFFTGVAGGFDEENKDYLKHKASFMVSLLNLIDLAKISRPVQKDVEMKPSHNYNPVLKDDVIRGEIEDFFSKKWISTNMLHKSPDLMKKVQQYHQDHNESEEDRMFNEIMRRCNIDPASLA